MKKTTVSVITTVLGIALAGAGLLMLKLISSPQGILRTLPYICLGLGCGVFGQGAGELLGMRAAKKKPETAKQMEIEKNDERNVFIALRAKAKAFDVMITVFGALALVYALINAGTAVTLLLVFAYLFVIGCELYYRIVYRREM